MKKVLSILAALALLVSGAAYGQGAHPLSAYRLDAPYSYALFTAPTGCISTSVPFFGVGLKLGCDAGLTYDAATDTLTTGTAVANVRTGTTSVSAAPATITITNTTNATPIVVTATAHGLVTGDRVSISGITGNTNANGYFKVTRLTADTFSLQNYSTGAGIAGNGAHGGTPVAVAGIVQAGRVMVGDGTAAQPSWAWASDPTSGWSKPAGSTWDLNLGGALHYRFGVNNLTIKTDLAKYSLGLNADTHISYGGIATLQLGAANAASPVAQALKVQDATGTNANGAATFTIKGPAGTGTGTPGATVFQAAVGTSSGSTAHTQTAALKIVGAASGGVPSVVLAATQSPASGAACTQWTIAVDASYIYVCTASGAWKRAALTGGY